MSSTCSRALLRLASGAACAALAAGVACAEPISYPGTTWGSISYPSGLVAPENHDVLLAGRIEQGAIWFRFGERSEWSLNTYAAINYSADNKGLPYNNKLTPLVGVKITRRLDGGLLDLGVQLAHERRFKDHQSNTGVQAYAGWWFGWDLKK